MMRDVKDRLIEFGTEIEIHHVGITQEQIAQYNPPPNPAKITDPRAKWYIQQFGPVSREVDALPPDVLLNKVEMKIQQLIDSSLLHSILEQEKKDKLELQDIASQFYM